MSGHGRTVIDAEGLILGRMASIVAKRLLDGERIDIVNAERAIVSGRRLQIIKERKKFLVVGRSGRKGPIHYRKPNAIVRRTIRGMLPHRKTRGIEAFARLKVHISVPEALESAEAESLPEAHVERLRGRYMTVGEIAKNIGWKV
ncbi:MAG TPA: 50S ribosomal protein L13 [Patescibacteria group bacterium]|nr:50S ribosomal protein L13 [Patescibacteria group bacterium]